jgi:hypothetical protein
MFSFNDEWTESQWIESDGLATPDFSFAFQTKNKGIQMKRKRGIINNIMPLMPAEFHDFWINISTNDDNNNDDDSDYNDDIDDEV